MKTKSDWTWEEYLAERDERKRWDMLQAKNRLSYDHVDDWLMSLFDFLWRRNDKALSELRDRVEKLTDIEALRFSDEGFSDEEMKLIQLTEREWLSKSDVLKSISSRRTVEG